VGLKSRSKGKRGEREVVALAWQHGLVAHRTWNTAQSADATERCCDVLIEGLGPAQVKIVADGYKGLYDVLDGVELAFLRSDRHPWLAVLPATRLLDLLKRAGEP